MELVAGFTFGRLKNLPIQVDKMGSVREIGVARVAAVIGKGTQPPVTGLVSEYTYFYAPLAHDNLLCTR
jgi:hypothetical protein